MRAVAPQTVSPSSSKNDTSRGPMGSSQISSRKTPSSSSSATATSKTRSISAGFGLVAGRPSRPQAAGRAGARPSGLRLGLLGRPLGELLEELPQPTRLQVADDLAGRRLSALPLHPPRKQLARICRRPLHSRPAYGRRPRRRDQTVPVPVSYEGGGGVVVVVVVDGGGLGGNPLGRAVVVVVGGIVVLVVDVDDVVVEDVVDVELVVVGVITCGAAAVTIEGGRFSRETSCSSWRMRRAAAASSWSRLGSPAGRSVAVSWALAAALRADASAAGTAALLPVATAFCTAPVCWSSTCRYLAARANASCCSGTAVCGARPNSATAPTAIAAAAAIAGARRAG